MAVGRSAKETNKYAHDTSKLRNQILNCQKKIVQHQNIIINERHNQIYYEIKLKNIVCLHDERVKLEQNKGKNYGKWIKR